MSMNTNDPSMVKFCTDALAEKDSVRAGACEMWSISQGLWGN